MKRLFFIVILLLAVAKADASVSLSMGESGHNFFAKEEVTRTLFICNEMLEPKDITVRWKTSVFSAVIQEGEEKIELRELQGKTIQLTLEMPEVKQRSPITLKVQVICDGKLEAEKQWDCSVFPQNISDTIKNILKNKKLGLIDSSGEIKQIFDEFEIPFIPITNQLSIGAFHGDLIIIGPEEDPRMMLTLLSSIENKVADGTSVISFQEKMDMEDESDIPIPLTNISPLPLDIKNITILSPNHPVFTGLTGDNFNNWREDGVVTRFPLIKPTKGNFRVLAEADLSTAAILELISGEGKFIFCQLEVIDKFWEEPIVQKLFENIIRYALIKQEPLQSAVIYGNPEIDIMKILNSLSIAQDITGKSDIIIICLGKETDDTPKKEPMPPHIKETIEKGGTILIFASFPNAVDFLGIKKNIKQMKVAPIGQQRIYYRHEEIIALDKKNPLLMGINENEIDLLMRRGKMYKFQLDNADIVVCQSSFDEDNPVSLRIISQLLTNLGIKIEKEVINEETNFEL